MARWRETYREDPGGARDHRAAARTTALAVGIRVLHRRPRLCRKLDDEGRARAELALDLDRPAVALHDAQAHRQAEARAADFGLGREERLEDAGQELRRHSRARV